MTNDLEGMAAVSTEASKPAIRITPGDVPAPHAMVVAALFGGHLDGLHVANLEVAGTWPVITTMEQIRDKSRETVRFIPRRYTICLCEGRVRLTRRRQIAYCLEPV